MEKFMSDAEIAAQYENPGIISLTVDRCAHSEGFSGCLEVEFPNADNTTFDSYVCDNFIVYDNGCRRIAFDRWYPDAVYMLFCKKIRDKVREIFCA